MTDKEYASLSEYVVKLLSSWNISPESQIKILDLPDDTRTRTLQKYKQGYPLPRSKQILIRIEHLLAIDEALRTSYPLNSNMGKIWMNKPHRRFQKRTPHAVLSEGRLNNLISIRADLDCTFDIMSVVQD